MAKRSDFAQKLLDDLRVRKEKMVAPHSSSRSNSTAIDAYAYSKQTNRGRRDIRTNGTIGSGTSTGKHQNGYRASSRAPIIQEASNQMVAYGGGRSSGQVGDLSMALAFALENGGKLGFLRQIGKGNVHFGKMERKGSVNMKWGSTSQFPNLSHLHIEEISRGAQKLNQILKSCSNGDRFSIEIGKDLMKGALDLEESLRMLVNLQEASEYMVSSQRKNRITLLDEEDEDNEDDSVRIADQQKQLALLPRFSFDKSSRHARKTTAKATDREKQGKMTSTSAYSNRQSVSYSAVVKNQTALSEQKESKPEKERIPNVIAKLMGLNELPKSENSNYTTQKDSRSKPKKETWAIAQTMQENSKITGVKNTEIESQHNYPLMQNAVYVLQAEKSRHSNNVNLQVVIHDGKPPMKDTSGLKHVTRSGKATITPDNPQKHPQAIKPEKPVARKSAEAKLVMQGRAGFKEIRLQVEKQNGNQHKSLNSVELHRPSNLWKLDSSEEKRRGEVKEQQSTQEKLQATKNRGSEMMSRNVSNGVADLKKKQTHTDQHRLNKKSMRETAAAAAVQSRRAPNGTYHENPVRSKSSADLNFNIKDFSPKAPDHELAKEKYGISPVMEEKRVAVVTLEKVKTRRVSKSEIPRRTDEVVTRRNGTLTNFTRSQKHQSSILQEAIHRSLKKLPGHHVVDGVRASRTNQAEPHIIKSNKSTPRIQPLDLAQNRQKEAEQPSILYDPDEVECRGRLQEPATLVQSDSCKNSLSEVTDDEQNQAPSFRDGVCITGSNTLANVAGMHEESDNISSAAQFEDLESLNWRKQEPLIESEKHLKQIVIKSQLFLNAAEALFKLDIPFSILHDSGADHECSQDGDSKLVLECSYEVMKRKGRRQELNAHPNCAKVSISFVKIQSLDELVKQLQKDFEKLKLYGRNGKPDCQAEEYLPRMLEIDMYNWEADMNCMWDMGWDETMFAVVEVDEVVKDLERLLLRGLVEELTRDLIHT